MSTSSHEWVARAVQLQCSSPNFAEFCVAHVTDPRYFFLFSTADTADRHLYLRLLEERRMVSSSIDVAGHGCASGDRAAATAPFFSFPQRGARSSSGGCRGRYAFTRYDVRAVWDAIDDRIARVALTPAIDDDGTSSSAEALGSTIYGPHAPHTFPNLTQLQHFIEDVLCAASSPTDSSVSAIIAYMSARLLMTETFLLVLNYIVVELLHFTVLSSRDGNINKGTVDPTDADEEARPLRRLRAEDAAADGDTADSVPPHTSGDHAERYTEAAASVVHLVASLYAHQRRHAAQLCDAVTPRRPAYYQAAFEHYIASMVAAFSEAASAVPTVKSGTAAAFVLHTLDVWEAEKCFTDSVASELRAAREGLVPP